MNSLDWLVIGAYGLLMLGVGWYFARRTETADDYLLGGRRMGSWSIGLSLFATLLSAISYLAVPGEIIRHGPMILTGIGAVPLIILVVGWLRAPREVPADTTQ